MISQPLPTSERKRSRGSPAGTPKPRLRKILCAAIAGASLLVGACAAPLKTQSKQPLAGGPGPDEAPKAAATAIASDRDEIVRPAAALQPASVTAPPAAQAGRPEGPLPGSSVPEKSDAELFAAAMPEMTFHEALQYAVDHHPRLRAAQGEVGVARAKLITAGLLANPQLVMDFGTAVAESEGSQVTSRLTFTIPTADKLRLGKSVACAGIAHAECALSRETYLVLRQAGDAAVDLLYFQELLALQTRLSELAAKQAAIQHGRFEAQQVPFSDAIQADVVAKDIELRRLDTAAQLDTARLNLARAVGVTGPGPGRLKGQIVIDRLPPVALEKLLAVAERNAPQIGEARAALESSRRQWALARAKAVPDLQIGPRSRTAVGDDNRQTFLGGRIAFDLPMFDRNQGGICQSACQIEVDRARLEDAQLTAVGDAAAIYNELRSLQSRLQYFQTQAIPLADRTETVIRENEVTRAMPPIQICNLFLELVQIRQSYLQLRYRYETLYRHIEFLLGCPLVSLEETPAPNRP